MKLSSRQHGALEILASGIAFGFLAIFGKLAFAQGLSPGEFLALRFLIAASSLGLWLFFTQRRSLQLPFQTIRRCLILGCLGYAVFSSCFFIALKHLSASLTVLLLYLYPAFVAIGASLYLNERLGRAAKLALPLSLIGLVLLMGANLGAVSGLGLAAGIGSAAFYSIYILLSRKWLEGVDALAAVFYIQLGAAILLCLLHFRGEAAVLGSLAKAPLEILGAALISSVLAMALFLSGLKKLKAAEASILSTAEPVTAIIVAVLFFSETLAPIQWLGALLLLSSLIILAKSQNPA